ncbi:metallophosphoesterase [Qingshengfaniella alkalisoli]|uniref:Serine/threonine protein phosphatase n=1 Tax=Qingshengfaniella alkalisoli TaxID=2599296 RepID=A0A5B8IY05_9RHOB|nr:metallophosphoesterase [Qingshengfaniella alkalisoli]QDY69771.1 serine/threonine protein phosphatase [Qingshengfaniella alkalisoli]
MWRWLKSFMQKHSEPIDRPSPDQLTYVIGDIHGRLDLLEKLLPLIDTHAAGREHTRVFVGDYIDRGPDSAQVLHRLRDINRSDPSGVICLKGNHEDMMLNFLHGREHNSGLWLFNGGDMTLASFGVSPPKDEDDLNSVQADLADAMSGGLADWVEALPTQWTTGKLAVVHAALEPDLPLDQQSDRTRIWGNKEFLIRGRSDGWWVAHGHTVTRPPVIQPSRIATDTGAWFSDTLTAAAIAPDGKVEFIDTLSHQPS